MIFFYSSLQLYHSASFPAISDMTGKLWRGIGMGRKIKDCCDEYIISYKNQNKPRLLKKILEFLLRLRA